MTPAIVQKTTNGPGAVNSSNSYLIQKPSIAIGNAGTCQPSMVQKSAIVKSDTSKMISGPKTSNPKVPNTPVQLPDHEEIVSAGIRLADLEEFKEDEEEEIQNDELIQEQPLP